MGWENQNRHHLLSVSGSGLTLRVSFSRHKGYRASWKGSTKCNSIHNEGQEWGPQNKVYCQTIVSVVHMIMNHLPYKWTMPNSAASRGRPFVWFQLSSQFKLVLKGVNVPQQLTPWSALIIDRLRDWAWFEKKGVVTTWQRHAVDTFPIKLFSQVLVTTHHCFHVFLD